VIVVISGPGGVGKGTLVARLVERDPRLWLSRSWTTRDPRPGEAPDAYHFVSRDDFEARIAADGFLEWAPFLDYLQGTPLPEAPAGRDVVLEIDVQGARQVRERHPDALLLFIDAPSRDEQRRRLEARGDAPERVQQRLDIAEAEAEAAQGLGMRVIVNDDLTTALEELQAALEEHRSPSG
jgi:guanylate kinase